MQRRNAKRPRRLKRSANVVVRRKNAGAERSTVYI